MCRYATNLDNIFKTAIIDLNALVLVSISKKCSVTLQLKLLLGISRGKGSCEHNTDLQN